MPGLLKLQIMSSQDADLHYQLSLLGSGYTPRPKILLVKTFENTFEWFSSDTTTELDQPLLHLRIPTYSSRDNYILSRRETFQARSNIDSRSKIVEPLIKGNSNAV